MKVLELFAGTRSICKAFEARGHEVFSVEWNKDFENIDLYADIFTNHPAPDFKPPCKRGGKCHESAPRGSMTGTQGRKGKKERSRIPAQLCEHIAEICER